MLLGREVPVHFLYLKLQLMNPAIASGHSEDALLQHQQISSLHANALALKHAALVSLPETLTQRIHVSPQPIYVSVLLHRHQQSHLQNQFADALPERLNFCHLSPQIAMRFQDLFL